MKDGTAIHGLIYSAPVWMLMWAGIISGCVQVNKLIDKATEPPVIEQPADTLPTNPQTGPDLPGSRSEQWSLSRKDYDQTWRIRWPSTFAYLGAGSYCTANGNRADFRSYDTDHGARRPSYTLPLSTPLSNPVRCILYAQDGQAVAWFDGSVNASGRLP